MQRPLRGRIEMWRGRGATQQQWAEPIGGWLMSAREFCKFRNAKIYKSQNSLKATVGCGWTKVCFVQKLCIRNRLADLSHSRWKAEVYSLERLSQRRGSGFKSTGLRSWEG